MDKKSRCFETWKTKDRQWLMEELYKARELYRDERKKHVCVQYELSLDRTVEQENFNLATVLSDSGIRPHKLIISYTVKACDTCGYYDAIFDSCDGDFSDACPIVTNVETVSFYAFKISSGLLTGITTDFSNDTFHVVKVTDATTGEVLYERQDTEDEGE